MPFIGRLPIFVLSILWYFSFPCGLIHDSFFLFDLVISNVILLQETHIINIFGEDFYDSQLKVCMTGYIRPEMDFSSLGKYSR